MTGTIREIHHQGEQYVTKKVVEASLPKAVAAAIVSGQRSKKPKQHQPIKRGEPTVGVLLDLAQGDRFTRRI